MRTLVLMFVLVACVMFTPAVADTGAPEVEDPEEIPALEVYLDVSLPSEDSTAETAFSLVEDLREIPDLAYFEFRLRMGMDYKPSAVLSARFDFESLPELVAWHESDSVQGFLISLEQATDEPLKLKVRGSLAGT